jgi:hypothetical protein
MDSKIICTDPHKFQYCAILKFMDFYFYSRFFPLVDEVRNKGTKQSVKHRNRTNSRRESILTDMNPLRDFVFAEKRVCY